MKVAVQPAIPTIGLDNGLVCQLSDNREVICKHETTFKPKILLLKAEFGENL